MPDNVTRQEMLMRSIESPFRRDIYAEKNRYIRESATDYVRNGILTDDKFEQHAQNMQDIFNKYYSRTMRVFSAETMRQLRSEKRFSIWETLLLEWFTQYGGSKAKEVAGTTREDINRALRAGFEAEEPESLIARRILRTRGLSAFRADAIARTETHNAAMYASEGTAKSMRSEFDVQLMKRWNTVQDERTRISHAAMSNHPAVDLDGFFLVGGEKLARPGDPNGSAGNVINCRCVLTYETVQ